jgi:midasin (ATPase involved in ribosome maturation)
MRARTGKAARLTGVAFDKEVNELPEDPAIAAAEQKLKDEAAAAHKAEAEAKAAEEAANEAKVAEAVAKHDEA